MSATVTTIFIEIEARLSVAADLADLPLWFGPPRLNAETAQADLFLQVDQTDAEFDVRYEFEVLLVTRNAYFSNSIASLDAPTPAAGVGSFLAEKLVTEFEGVVGPLGWVSHVLKAGYERLQDQTTFRLTFEFVPV